MVLDRVENSEFILRDSLIEHSVSLSRGFYDSEGMMESCFNCFNDFGDNNECLALANEQFNMETKKMVSPVSSLFNYRRKIIFFEQGQVNFPEREKRNFN